MIHPPLRNLHHPTRNVIISARGRASMRGANLRSRPKREKKRKVHGARWSSDWVPSPVGTDLSEKPVPDNLSHPTASPPSLCQGSLLIPVTTKRWITQILCVLIPTMLDYHVLQHLSRGNCLDFPQKFRSLRWFMWGIVSIGLVFGATQALVGRGIGRRWL